jgi:hypothetical protein
MFTMDIGGVVESVLVSTLEAAAKGTILLIRGKRQPLKKDAMTRLNI